MTENLQADGVQSRQTLFVRYCHRSLFSKGKQALVLLLGVFIRETFLRAVQENSLQEIVRQEDGCLEYAYYAAVADAEKILLVEKWASEEQQQTHLRQLKRWKEQYIAETAVEKI